MAVYPSSVKVEAFTTSWVDISAYVVKDIEGSYGMGGTSASDRVASPGTLKLTLNNRGGQFSPSGVYAMAGFQKGTPIRLSITYGDETVMKWFGHIRDITLDAGGWGERLATVTVADWLDYASTYPITLNSVLYNQRISEAVGTIVNALPVQPINTRYSTGTDVFPTVLDTSKGITRATSEFQKLALSEWGFIYLRKDRWNGETLVVEARHDRRTTSTRTPIPVSTFMAGKLQVETSETLLLETGEKLLTDETQVVTYNKSASMKVTYGDNLRNHVAVKVYPRRVDTSPQVLYSLTSPIDLGVGETKVIKVKYRDPAQLATKVSGVDMVNPVSTTDYQMFQSSAGTGVNLTSYLSVSVIFGASDAEVTLTNNGTMIGYVTKLNLRGRGIYIYDALEFAESDPSSITLYGYSDESIDQKYQADDDMARGLARVLLNQEKNPRTVLESLTYVANISDELFQAFLFQDVGDLIYVNEPQTGVDGYYYIQGCKFKITQGGLVTVTYTVVEALTLNSGYWELEVPGHTELDSTTMLGY